MQEAVTSPLKKQEWWHTYWCPLLLL